MVHGSGGAGGVKIGTVKGDHTRIVICIHSIPPSRRR